MTKEQHHLQLQLTQLQLSKHLGAPTALYHLELFFGAVRHCTAEFECVESEPLDLRISLSGLQVARLEVWLMRGDLLVAQGQLEVQREGEHSAEVRLLLEFEQFGLLRLRYSLASESIERVVPEDRDEDLLKPSRVGQESRQVVEQSRRKSNEGEEARGAKATALITVSNARLTDQPLF